MSLLTVGFDILGMSPLTIVWAALGLLERDAAAIRRAEKKRAIERQRAEIEQLRRALRPAAQAAATRSGDGEQFVAFGERLYAELRGAALDAGAASPLEAATRAYEAAAARPLTGAAARLLASADGDDFLRAGAALYAALVSRIYIRDSAYEHGDSHTDGGAVFIDYASEVIFERTLFKHNSAKNGGGARLERTRASPLVSMRPFSDGLACSRAATFFPLR